MLIRAENIEYTYPGNERCALKDVNLTIDSGEYIVITGNNGSGKSTLALVLAGVIEPDSGNVFLDGKNIFSHDIDENWRSDIGFLFQDPREGILGTSVERDIAFGPENLALPLDRLRKKVDELVERFGLQDYRKSPVEHLSGGMVERCALASAIATDPRIIILDEPDSFLDFEGKIMLNEEISKLLDSGKAILHITQSDIIGDKNYHMDNGNLISQNKSFPKIVFRIAKNCQHHDEILSAKQIKFSYDGKTALDNITMAIYEGCGTAILGRSGSGKTTLARVLSELYKPDSGQIESHGKVGISFQFPERQLFAETVIKDVQFGPQSLQLDSPEIFAQQALNRMNVPEEYWNRSPFLLSDGEQRRVGIAGLLAVSPRCLIFDEPTATLDINQKLNFIKLVNELKSEGTAIAVITHDLNIASACCSSAVVLDRGRIIYAGEMKKLLDDRKFRNNLGLGTEEDLSEV